MNEYFRSCSLDNHGFGTWESFLYLEGKINLEFPQYVIHITVFENHILSLIQHCERSVLRLHFEWTQVNQKFKKWSNLKSFWKPKACGQTELPDRTVLIGQKLVEKAKIQKFKCDILSNIQTMCYGTSKLLYELNNVKYLQNSKSNYNDVLVYFEEHYPFPRSSSLYISSQFRINPLVDFWSHQ